MTVWRFAISFLLLLTVSAQLVMLVPLLGVALLIVGVIVLVRMSRRYTHCLTCGSQATVALDTPEGQRLAAAGKATPPLPGRDFD